MANRKPTASQLDKLVDIMLPGESPAQEGSIARETVDMEDRLITMSRVEEPSFQDLQIKKGKWRVTWEWIGEGLDGDYDHSNPDDYPHLRFSCDQWNPDNPLEPHEEGSWEDLDDSSYCTRLPTTTPRWMLMRAADVIMEALGESSPKHALEQLSWFCIDDFKRRKNSPAPSTAKTMAITLVDQGGGIEGHAVVKAQVEWSNGTLWIMPEGYGDNSAAPGFGSPICLELWEGRLRLLAWDDINNCDPKVIDMEGARETQRLDNTQGN